MTKTCYVVGAGGSCPYKLPNGPDLIQKIVDLKQPGGASFERYQQKLLQELHYLQRALMKSDPDSIDQFIQENPDYHEAAAFAVAVILLHSHHCYVPKLNDPDDWIRVAFNQHRKSICGKNPDTDVSFITYNYDNLIENFIERKLCGYVTRHEAQSRRARVKITHLYGQLGDDVEFERKFERPGTVFDGIPADIVTLASQACDRLRFYWEDPDAEDKCMEIASEQLRSASRIVVISIGQALGPLDNLFREAFKRHPTPTRIYATAYGLLDFQVGRLGKILGESAVILPLKARQLLDQHVYI